MIYSIQNQHLKQDIPSYRIVNHNPYDLRNFAVILLYPDEVEQVYRKKYLRYHIDYLYPLYKNSNILPEYITYLLEEKEYNHYWFDKNAAQNETATIYCNDPESQNKHEYIFYLPESLTEFQKQFLRDRKAELLKLQSMQLHLYNTLKEEFQPYQKIEEYHSLTPYQALKKKIQN